MRQFNIAMAAATGLVGLWVAIVPLTAQPAPRPPDSSPALSRALFLCRGPNGIDRACTAALARALAFQQSSNAPAKVADRSCRADPAILSALHD
jgi:hypothetical protein